MASNLNRYKADLDRLILQGENLQLALVAEQKPDEWKATLKQLPLERQETLKHLPAFNRDYQAWYSEAMSLVRQLLPDRLEDFVRHYEKPKNRKHITYEN